MSYPLAQRVGDILIYSNDQFTIQFHVLNIDNKAHLYIFGLPQCMGIPKGNSSKHFRSHGGKVIRTWGDASPLRTYIDRDSAMKWLESYPDVYSDLIEFLQTALNHIDVQLLWGKLLQLAANLH